MPTCKFVPNMDADFLLQIYESVFIYFKQSSDYLYVAFSISQKLHEFDNLLCMKIR